MASLTWACYAQVISIKDKDNDEPLEFVTLFSEVPRATAVTNASGMADISAFEGAERIEIRLIGYNHVVSS